MDCSEPGDRLSPLCLALLPFQKLQALQQDQCSLAYITLPRQLFDVTRAVVGSLAKEPVCFGCVHASSVCRVHPCAIGILWLP